MRTSDMTNRRLKWYQFSLRKFLLACALLAVLFSIGTSMLREYRYGHTSGSSGGYFLGAHTLYEMNTYRRRDGKTFASHVVMYEKDYCEAMPLEVTKPINSSVVFNGRSFNSLSKPLLIINGPYGKNFEIELTLEEMEYFRYGGLPLTTQFFQKRIEPEMYRLEGETNARGEREGIWIYRLHDDTLYMQAEYQQGQRHGEWVNYYPNGNIRFRRHYQLGRKSGKWEYFLESGELFFTSSWDPLINYPGSGSSSGGGTGKVEHGFYHEYETQNEKPIHIRYNNEEGSCLSLNGKVFPRVEYKQKP